MCHHVTYPVIESNCAEKSPFIRGLVYCSCCRVLRSRDGDAARSIRDVGLAELASHDDALGRGFRPLPYQPRASRAPPLVLARPFTGPAIVFMLRKGISRSRPNAPERRMAPPRAHIAFWTRAWWNEAGPVPRTLPPVRWLSGRRGVVLEYSEALLEEPRSWTEADPSWAALPPEDELDEADDEEAPAPADGPLPFPGWIELKTREEAATTFRQNRATLRVHSTQVRVAGPAKVGQRPQPVARGRRERRRRERRRAAEARAVILEDLRRLAQERAAGGVAAPHAPSLAAAAADAAGIALGGGMRKELRRLEQERAAGGAAAPQAGAAAPGLAAAAAAGAAAGSMQAGPRPIQGSRPSKRRRENQQRKGGAVGPAAVGAAAAGVQQGGHTAAAARCVHALVVKVMAEDLRKKRPPHHAISTAELEAKRILAECRRQQRRDRRRRKRAQRAARHQPEGDPMAPAPGGPAAP